MRTAENADGRGRRVDPALPRISASSAGHDRRFAAQICLMGAVNVRGVRLACGWSRGSAPRRPANLHVAHPRRRPLAAGSEWDIDTQVPGRGRRPIRCARRWLPGSGRGCPCPRRDDERRRARRADRLRRLRRSRRPSARPRRSRRSAP